MEDIALDPQSESYSGPWISCKKCNQSFLSPKYSCYHKPRTVRYTSNYTKMYIYHVRHSHQYLQLLILYSLSVYIYIDTWIYIYIYVFIYICVYLYIFIYNTPKKVLLFSLQTSQTSPWELTEASPLDVFVHRLEDGTSGLLRVHRGGTKIFQGFLVILWWIYGKSNGGLMVIYWDLPSGNGWHSYWTWSFSSLIYRT